jgi:hypothetical protein
MHPTPQFWDVDLLLPDCRGNACAAGAAAGAEASNQGVCLKPFICILSR